MGSLPSKNKNVKYLFNVKDFSLNMHGLSL